jgi:4-hydroxy-3-methylbut-2-en-1-yl diphosphate reductase
MSHSIPDQAARPPKSFASQSLAALPLGVRRPCLSISRNLTVKPMRIVRANHLGMCFGVRDAITTALQQARQGPLTILGELVHNEAVLSVLRQRGIQIEDQVANIRTENVLITAHGASERTLGKLHAEGLNVAEATCPLVHHAHRAVQRLVRENFHPVIIGQRNHVEVRGLTEDLHEYDVVLSEEDVDHLQERPRFGIAAQTTQPIHKVRQLVALIRRRFPRAEVRFEDTVCQPTKLRQMAALELAQQCEVVVVVGGVNSNNTRQLAAACLAFCSRVHHVQTASDLQPDWFDDAETVGLTAGTSTPDVTIDAVEDWLRRLAESHAPRATEPSWMPMPRAPLEPTPVCDNLCGQVQTGRPAPEVALSVGGP